MIVYTVLFTLLGKDPAENRYVEMFYVWVSHLIKNAGLDEKDKICVLIDKPTLDFMNNERHLGNILKKCRGVTEYWIVPQPIKISQGMALRYSIDEYPTLCSECSLYIDIDVLVVAPLKAVREVCNDTIMAIVEGFKDNEDYGGKVLPKDEAAEGYPGFTSAIFAFSAGEYVKQFMRNVKGGCLAQDPPFYTVDQPFFNKYVYEDFVYKNKELFILPREYVEVNTMEPSASAVFVNYSGDPGNGQKHVAKLIVRLCMNILTAQALPPAPAPQHLPQQIHEAQESQGPSEA